MNKLYAVVFDNDPEYPGKIQYLGLEEVLGCWANLTEDLKVAKLQKDMCKQFYPHINYRVVEVTLKEIE